VIAVFSTSSPIASVALFEGDRLLAAEYREAQGKAGAACLWILEALLSDPGGTLGDLTGFVADVGPGGFSGTRVGVTLAKSLGFAKGVKVAGVDAFDLISSAGPVAIPVRRDTYLVREPGRAASLTSEVEGSVGYGPAFESPIFPLAERAIPSRLTWIEPEALLPEYLVEPSISTPKKPFAPRVAEV